MTTKATLVLGMMMALGTGSSAWAQGDTELRDKMRYLEERVKVLEEEKAAANENGPALEFGGLIEVEYGVVDDYDGERTSDVVLATVELAAGVRINDWVRGDIVLLFEEDETEPMDLDVGTLTLGNPDASPFFLSAGRQYVPFGNFESSMVSDPLTLEIGETRESSILVGYQGDGPYAGLYLYNGDVEDDGDDRANDFGAHAGWAWEGDGSALDVGASWIGNLADSDALQEAENGSGGSLSDGIVDRVAGLGLHAIFTTGPWTVVGEYVGATDAFDPADLAFGGSGAQPSAWNLEAAYGFELMGREVAVAVGHQESAEALALGLPESKNLVALSVGIYESTALSFEYAVADDYGTGDGGTGEKETAFTVQLAAEF